MKNRFKILSRLSSWRFE